MNLKGKVAVVIGASSGIGEGIARAIAEQKPKGLVLAARRENLLGKLASSINDTYQVNPLVVRTDITSPKDIKNLFERTINKYNRLDLLVNSAGVVQSEKSIDDTSVEEIISIIQTNLTGTMLAAHYVMPIFKRQKYGVMVNISSGAGKNAYAGEAPYCGSKAGVDHFVRALDEDLKVLRKKGFEIYTFAIGPGFIDTQEARRKFPNVGEDIWKKVPSVIEFGRLVTGYLLDPKKSYKNGPVVHIDTW